MAEDYYKTLEISRGASQAEIQEAYRKLARKHHPDLNPDDKTAKEKFQKVQAAFDVLNDPSKRELYDRYGSSFESMQGAGGPGQGAGGPHRTYTWSGQGAPGFEDLDFSQFFGERFGVDPEGGGADIFSQFRRPGGRTKRRAAPRTGDDLQSELLVPFSTAIIGGEQQITVQRPSGKSDTIAVKIPAGIQDGGKIRLRGQGEESPDGTPGDLLITIHVAPHPYFERRGNNLEVKLPITLAEAALGAKVDVPTPRGTIALRIPPNTSSGKKLRIKGYGVAPRKGDPGDLYAEVQIVLPDKLNDATLEAIKQHEQGRPENPRADLHW